MNETSYETVAVSSLETALIGLKRTALAFDRIAVWNLNTMLSHVQSVIPADLRVDLDWLQEHGIIYDLRIKLEPHNILNVLPLLSQAELQANAPDLQNKIREISRLSSEAKRLLTIEPFDLDKAYQFAIRSRQLLIDLELITADQAEGEEVQGVIKALANISVLELLQAPSKPSLMWDYLSRVHSTVLNTDSRFDAFPLLRNERVFDVNTDRRANVVTATIRHFPIPDDSTPWEEIEAFRLDPETHRKRLAFRVWIQEMVNSGKSGRELEDHLAWLLSEYEHHLQLHRMKFRRGVIETVVTHVAEAAESAIKLRLSRLAKALFAYREHRVNLLEAEMKLPGREIAYLATARERFPSLPAGG
jgi:hypothetical protein